MRAGLRLGNTTEPEALLLLACWDGELNCKISSMAYQGYEGASWIDVEGEEACPLPPPSAELARTPPVAPISMAGWKPQGVPVDKDL